MYFSTLFLAFLRCVCVCTPELCTLELHSAGQRNKERKSFSACVLLIYSQAFESTHTFRYSHCPFDRLPDHLFGRKRYLVKTMANKAQSSLFANQNATVSWSYACRTDGECTDLNRLAKISSAGGAQGERRESATRRTARRYQVCNSNWMRVSANRLNDFRLNG